MTGPGRPPVKPTISCLLWVMVELMRDRRKGERLSVRVASERLAKHLAACFVGGRQLDKETIRGHCKKFGKERRRPDRTQRTWPKSF